MSESSETMFAIGDRVWLRNANGGVMTTDDHRQREIAFKVAAVLPSVHGTRYVLDTHNSAARMRYCGPVGVTAESIVKAGA